MANITYLLGKYEQKAWMGWAGLLGMLLLKGGMESLELKKRGRQLFMTNSSFFGIMETLHGWAGPFAVLTRYSIFSFGSPTLLISICPLLVSPR